MPLILGHALVGATAVAAVHPQGRAWKPLALGAALAVAPDLDFALLWGLGMRGVHRSFTHSFAFAAAVGAVIWLVLGLERWRAALAFGLACASHGVLDFGAAKAASGVMLFWPFSAERFKLGTWGFAEMSPGMPLPEILYWTAWEAVGLVPIFLAVLFVRARWRPGP
jgi:membrane-bound metal-dependent hydrolase YbcI (DUF457 family)